MADDSYSRDLAATAARVIGFAMVFLTVWGLEDETSWAGIHSIVVVPALSGLGLLAATAVLGFRVRDGEGSTTSSSRNRRLHRLFSAGLLVLVLSFALSMLLPLVCDQL